MKTRLLLSIYIFILTVSTSVFSEVVEVENFKDILDYVDGGTLVILDIDDTLLVPVQTLGTDVWFLSRLKQHQQAIQDRTQAFDRALAEWEAIRHLTKVKIVEEGAEEIVNRMQENHIVVMGLTTQGLALATRTVVQLKSLGIDLSKTAPSVVDHYFMNGNTGVLFRQGILFTAGSSKGGALVKLLETIGYQPKTVVFLNDKETHVKDLEAGVASKSIPFTGLRYSYSDSRIASYREDIADIQWTHSTFGSILSDEEADRLLCEIGDR